jgi:hypothetical protein
MSLDCRCQAIFVVCLSTKMKTNLSIHRTVTKPRWPPKQATSITAIRLVDVDYYWKPMRVTNSKATTVREELVLVL